MVPILGHLPMMIGGTWSSLRCCAYLEGYVPMQIHFFKLFYALDLWNLGFCKGIRYPKPNLSSFSELEITMNNPAHLLEVPLTVMFV